MRVEPHAVGSIMHIIKRGTRGMEIVRDDQDRFNFVRSLYILNDYYQDNNWRTYISGKPLFYRPKSWPQRRPLVSVLAWTLLDNHFHLLLKETEEGGIAKFMQRLGGSMTLTFNEKYDGSGSIFQGGYRGRIIETDEYLQYVHTYIVAKNTFDMFPGGFKKALAQFERAWEFAQEYRFTSLFTSITGTPSPVLDMNEVQSLGFIKKDFKKYAKSMLLAHAQSKNVAVDIAELILEEW